MREVIDQAQDGGKRDLRKPSRLRDAAATFSPAVIDAIVKSALGMFDEQQWRLRKRAEVSASGMLDLMIDQYVRHRATQELRELRLCSTLEKMARGGSL